MRFEQGTAFAIVGTIMSWFVRDRLRYDLVATLALFATVMVGIVPAEKAFSVSATAWLVEAKVPPSSPLVG